MYSIALSDLCTSPRGLHGLSRSFPEVVHAPWLAALFTVWDWGPMGWTACVQDVIRDCTKWLLRCWREEWKLKCWETMLMWKSSEYDRVFSVSKIGKKMRFWEACRTLYITLLNEAEEKMHKRHLQGWTDRAKVGSVIARSILEVYGASLLMPNRAHPAKDTSHNCSFQDRFY